MAESALLSLSQSSVEQSHPDKTCVNRLFMKESTPNQNSSKPLRLDPGPAAKLHSGITRCLPVQYRMTGESRPRGRRPSEQSAPFVRHQNAKRLASHRCWRPASAPKSVDREICPPGGPPGCQRPRTCAMVTLPPCGRCSSHLKSIYGQVETKEGRGVSHRTRCFFDSWRHPPPCHPAWLTALFAWRKPHRPTFKPRGHRCHWDLPTERPTEEHPSCLPQLACAVRFGASSLHPDSIGSK